MAGLRWPLPVALLALSFCFVVGARRFCSTEALVRTGKLFPKEGTADGDNLFFDSVTPLLIRHPCNQELALFVGHQVFLSKNNFESSLIPLSIPKKMQAGIPKISSIIYSSSRLVMIINGKVFGYDYNKKTWDAARGVETKVSTLSGEHCCYSVEYHCSTVSHYIYAYSRGKLDDSSHIYFSTSAGLEFEELVLENKGVFKFTRHPLGKIMLSPFTMAFSETVTSLRPPGLKGIIIFWTKRDMKISFNCGQTMDPVIIWRTRRFPHTSISAINSSLFYVTASETELAALTEDYQLFYGSMGLQQTTLIHIKRESLWVNGSAFMFLRTGVLEIIKPLKDPGLRAFDFDQCTVNIQTLVFGADPKLPECPMEILSGQFSNQMYVIDLGENMELSAAFVPKPSRGTFPIVTVSNPHSLGFQVQILENGYTSDGNIQFILKIALVQQHISEKTEKDFTSSQKLSSLSTVTVDIAYKGVSCIDLQPLTALIVLGCPLNKRIEVVRDITVCNRGIMNTKVLVENFAYTISKKIYDPSLMGGENEAKEDRVVPYNYTQMGCPALVYHNFPWRPQLELWHDQTFLGYITSEFVILEVNGIFDYTYLLSVKEAKCESQPQNWTSVIKSSRHKTPFSWNRENYVSCHQNNSEAPLKWLGLPYEVLGGSTSNRVVFARRNGYYIFSISVVDHNISYCNLSTTFSIYVYGALPRSVIPAIPVGAVLSVLGFFSLYMTYREPNKLQMIEESKWTLLNKSLGSTLNNLTRDGRRSPRRVLAKW
ncbi:cation channel sperm-associated protein subunit delta isoform X2 [Tachyglossus aculeatus]|uniref:cation channel sperm-associated protein subunit delta isoform X2 n=1 Tax=Tachyglossus aculeatus TaxID=9261 RepID=UPI0018F59292|nr:cation channel sperm-associated protein subunit delta isoform X2 [Tachyglossus aculeatus]